MSLPREIPLDVRPERLFAPLGRRYERASALLSLGLEAGWRRALVTCFGPRDGARYLDVATGTGLVAREVAQRASCLVVGVDISEAMLREARGERIHFVRARAERLPFRDGHFDGLTFTYLLRYVDDPVATLRELARAVRPGGRVAMLEFGRPSSPLARAGWWAYTRLVLPLLGSRFDPDWRAVGAFLGPSVDRFYERYDMERVWRDAGLAEVRSHPLFLGAAVVVTGTVG